MAEEVSLPNNVEDSRGPGPTPWWDILLWVVLLWGWALPSAFFWGLTQAHQVLLPWIPHYCWIGPGALWQDAPWLFVPMSLLLPGLFAVGARRRPLPLRPARIAGYALLALVLLVHVVWGGVLVGSVVLA